MLCVYLILLFLLLLFLPMPSRRSMDAWRGTAFAHRGLHGRGIAENTLPAFKAAAARGYGIELDVRLSRDGQVMVFHDETLTRMAGDARRVAELDCAELMAIPLLPGEGRIPRLADVLRAVDGSVPLLIEIKRGDDRRGICERTAALLKGYGGPALVESFDPLVVAWFRWHHPQYRRGQLVGRPVAQAAARMGRAGKWMLSGIAFNAIGRPDFIACDVSSGKLPATLGGNRPVAYWTVRDEETFRRIIEAGNMAIFEETGEWNIP
ncbi:MAG: glycerophosphodiester phosphodiesterase [Clostridiales bacterium]|nr:glycerophosphodiester phosphodiesterase [Clostridiales bacterium]